jgi:hypothetical protein
MAHIVTVREAVDSDPVLPLAESLPYANDGGVRRRMK